MYISKGLIALEETVYEYVEEMRVNISVVFVMSKVSLGFEIRFINMKTGHCLSRKADT